MFLPSKRLLSAFYNMPPSKNPSKNLCLYRNPYQAPSKNPSKKHLLLENLLRTLLRSVRLHDPLGVRPKPRRFVAQNDKEIEVWRKKIHAQYDWTTGVPDNGNEWRSSAAHLARTPRFPLFVLCLVRVETEGLLDYQGKAGIMSIVQWNVRPVIVGVENRNLPPKPFV